MFRKTIIVIILIFLTTLFVGRKLNANTTNHREAISGKDVIINNTLKPYTQDNIRSISKLKAIDSDLQDISNKIILIEDLWGMKKTVEGTFIQKYQVTNSNNITSYYILTIINIRKDDSNINNSLGVLYLSSNKKHSIQDIISLIEIERRITILDYIVKEDNYSSNYSKEGSYKLIVSIKTTSNKEEVLEYSIVVSNDQDSNSKDIKTIVIIILSIILIGLGILFFMKGKLYAKK